MECESLGYITNHFLYTEIVTGIANEPVVPGRERSPSLSLLCTLGTRRVVPLND